MMEYRPPYETELQAQEYINSIPRHEFKLSHAKYKMLYKVYKEDDGFHVLQDCEILSYIPFK